ncbi:hypothetical protein [cf. Phormidesmis sp. LEGE 11477]|uniref:hypothetical protein n=1 Tax=cf. Phormidesmis sp. LEGE 11477 TaxID=1828680 RepID=UPI001A0120E8|nr:hypothetical protein [cf. Phormidesmis sp. LEGE 11477]MBE9064526.1 hypothetical protein [cf. Phormidesmis sp. LEGE 11477]
MDGLGNSDESADRAETIEKLKRLVDEASTLAKDGKYQEAIEFTDKLLEDYPDFAGNIYALRGTIHGLMDEIEVVIAEIRKGEAICEARGDSQGVEIMKQFADDLQYSLDSGEWAEELEEERRIAEEQENY